MRRCGWWRSWARPWRWAPRRPARGRLQARWTGRRFPTPSRPRWPRHARSSTAAGRPRRPGGWRGALRAARARAPARPLVDGGRPAEALERLTALDQADPRVRLLTGVALYHADRRREAIDVLERVRPTLPDSSIERREAEQVLGLSLYLEGRFAEAIPWLERT